MPLKLSMSISQDGNGKPIKLVKLFQVLFLNEFRQRIGGTIRVYTGVAFEGTFADDLDDPALLIKLSSGADQPTQCADLTSSFASQLVPVQTFWGRDSHPVDTSNSLREEMAKIEPKAAEGRLTDFITTANTAGKSIFVLGDNAPGTILAFPGQVYQSGYRSGRVSLLDDLGSLVKGSLRTFHCYAWIKQELICVGVSGNPYTLEFHWDLTLNSSSHCYDVSHFFVAERNYRVISNRCLLVDNNGTRNTYCGGGVKEISVQDQVKYFDEWLALRVRNSTILEVKDKDWFRTTVNRQMSVEMALENQLFHRYVLNITSALGILFGAFAATGLDHNRIAEAKLYFVNGIFAWSFLSETGIWFLLSAVGGLAFVRMFSPTSNVLSQSLAWVCLFAYGIFSSIVFFLDSAARVAIMTNFRWIVYLPSLSIISGIASLIFTQGELVESLRARLSQYFRGARP